MEHAGASMADKGTVSEALFAQLIMQQANMALMLMGKTAHPGSGKMEVDLDGARFFIDQLEMIETKTRGNLTSSEQGYLKETLMGLRMAYVEAVEEPGPASSPKPEAQAAPSESAANSPEIQTGSGDSGDDEHRKKFSKKY
jgi:hypothetical protein